MLQVLGVLLTSALLQTGASPAAGSDSVADPDACRVEHTSHSTRAESPAHRHSALNACTTARDRFALLFGEAAPHVVILLRDEPGYRTAATGGSALVAWAAAAAAQEWMHVLPHETMHALLLARHFPDGLSSRHDGYGTPLPDWFEEAVAIWAEPPAAREARLAHARRLAPAARDLPAILAAPHPATQDPAPFAARDGEQVAMGQALHDFYPQAFAVLSFVHDAGGADAVRKLASRLIRNPGDESAIAGLPGLPLQMSDVVAAWDIWIGRQL